MSLIYPLSLSFGESNYIYLLGNLKMSHNFKFLFSLYFIFISILSHSLIFNSAMSNLLSF